MRLIMSKKKLIFSNIVIIVILLVLMMIFIISKITQKTIKTDAKGENNIEAQEEQENNKKQNEVENETTEVTEEENELISDLKDKSGITGNDDLYVVGEEYDGRKTLVINPQIEFNVVLAGILKQNKPQISEVEKILKNKPQNAGIWINEQSRDRFLKMINSETESEYYVDSNGYLRVSKTENQNEYDKVLYNSINGNNLFIIDISGFCYCLDEVTGEVVCYQFEDMDPYQAYEVYEFSNSIIYIITSNHSKVLSSEEIFSELIESMRGEI